MKEKILGFFLVVGTVLFFTVSFSDFSEASSEDTNIGIEFKGGKVTTQEEGTKDPLIPNKPVIKSSGTLPRTGELLQPIMYLLFGFLLVIVIAATYLSISKNEDKEEYYL